MKELWDALELRKKYNRMDFHEMVKEFEEFSGQKIPEEAKEEFLYTGMNNIDFLMMGILNDYGLKELGDYFI